MLLEFTTNNCITYIIIAMFIVVINRYMLLKKSHTYNNVFPFSNVYNAVKD